MRFIEVLISYTKLTAKYYQIMLLTAKVLNQLQTAKPVVYAFSCVATSNNQSSLRYIFFYKIM